MQHSRSYCISPVQRWNRSGFSRPDPTGKFQNHCRLTGRATGRSTGFWSARSTDIFTEVFFHCSMYLTKNFQKGEMHGWGVKICDFGRESQKKKEKKLFFFAKNDSILRPFLFKFSFERPVLSREKRAQNKHKNHWRAQAKLYWTFFQRILCEGQKMKSQICSYLWQIIICNLPSSKH